MENLKDLKEKTEDLKVLFVDDEEAIRYGTGTLLKKFFNSVVIATNGEEGLEKFKNEKFDVVISDIKMPKLNGIEMMNKIQLIKPDIFTIFITASRGKNELGDVKYDLYLTKPISFDSITTMLQKIVKSKEITQ
jgi:CheY-like chemotaxis protein